LVRERVGAVARAIGGFWEGLGVGGEQVDERWGVGETSRYV
jgi:hypothetical protein